MFFLKELLRGNKTQRIYEVDDILPDMDRVEDGEDPLLTGLLHVSLVLVQEASDKMDQWSSYTGSSIPKSVSLCAKLSYNDS